MVFNQNVEEVIQMTEHKNITKTQQKSSLIFIIPV